MLVLLAACLAASPPTSSAPASSTPAVQWLRGQTHAHSNGSGDSETPPADVARWYETHGYDFLVITDHDVITTLPWNGPMLLIPGIEITQNLHTCDPPPEGRFCPVHVNALFVDPTARFASIGTPGPRRERYAAAITTAHQLGGLAQINHPNWEWMVDGPLLGALASDGAAFVEIANGSGTDDAGDERHPSTEALWDAALTSGARLFAVATDDAHHYDDADAVEASGKPAYRGDRGFVMVHAARDPASIRDALARGDFYASTGLLLTDVAVIDGALTITAADPVTVRFIGAGGAVLAEFPHSTTAGFPLTETGYVRAVATSAAGTAWTQPVWAP